MERTMDTRELLKKVRKIEIKTRGLTREIFAGQYHSAFKGRGMTFSEVREYTVGDDIRTIDWNVTARFNHPYVKVFEEERELTVILMIDVSGSEDFGSMRQKREYMAEVAGVLAFSAIENNDKIGVIFFSDTVEKFIPPAKGRKHGLRIISEILSYQPRSKGTNLTEALRFLINAIKKRAIVFLMSDFLDGDFEKSLIIASRKHDLIGIKINDIREKEIPNLGLVNIVDAESGENIWVDTSNRAVRTELMEWFDKHDLAVKNSFNRAGIDFVRIFTGEDYVKALIQLFKRRKV